MDNRRVQSNFDAVACRLAQGVVRQAHNMKCKMPGFLGHDNATPPFSVYNFGAVPIKRQFAQWGFQFQCHPGAQSPGVQREALTAAPKGMHNSGSQLLRRNRPLKMPRRQIHHMTFGVIH